MALSFPVWQRRALRTASEKLKSRTSFSATAVQHSPATRVNRYIGRLIEARQTESGTSDLNHFTLFYSSRDRERRVRLCTHLQGNICFTFIAAHTHTSNMNFSLLHMRITASWLHDLPPSVSFPHIVPYTVYNSVSPTLVVCVCVCACLYEKSTHPLRRGFR